MLLLHPTIDSANAKDNDGETAVMAAARLGCKEVLSELVKHESVSLDIGNVSEDVRCREIIDEAKQIRRLKIREQQRQVSKVLLDGLYDSDSPLFMLLGVRTEVVGEIIWKVDPTRSISESQW